MIRRRGFTLFELVFACAIALLVVGLGLINARTPRESAGSSALAEVIADELRLARQTAMSRQIPVAVGFPTNGGTLPVCQSLYVMGGETVPRLFRVQSFTGDFPQSVIANVFWTPDPARMATGQGVTAVQPLPTSASDQYPVDTWLPMARRQDYVFLFTPSGVVRTNGAPLFDGNYHILISQGLEFTPDSPPGAASGMGYWRATRVCQPYTVTLSPAGSVQVRRGTTAATLSEIPTALPTLAVGLPPSIPLGGNNAPVIQGVSLFPIPSGPIPGSADVMICPGQHVTMRVEAEDPDGDELFCEWSSGGNRGRFSSASRDRMEWDPQLQRWVSYWEWIPDSTVAMDSNVDLTVRVYDRSNTVTAAADSAVFNVRFGRGGRVVFHVLNDDGYYDVAMVNMDGTGERLITDTPEEDERHPSFSPDGSMIAFESWSEDTLSNEIFVMNYDGTGIRQLTFTPSEEEEGPFEWSPDGTRLAFFNYGSGWSRDIEIMALDGTDRRTLGPESYWAWYGEPPLTWHRTGLAVAYANQDGDLSYYNLITDTTTLLRDAANPNTQLISPHWSPMGDDFALIESYYDGPLDEEVFVMRVDQNGNIQPGSYRRLLPTYWSGTWEFKPTWDSTGTKVAFDSAEWFGEPGDVHVVDVPSGSRSRVGAGTGPVAWTPQGNLLYQSYYTGWGSGSVDLLLADLTGGSVKTLTTHDDDHEINRQPASAR